MNMKTGMTLLVMTVLTVAAPAPTTTVAAEAAATLDLVSAYVFRGVTFNDGAALQPGLEVGGLPLTLGVWGNMDLQDYDALGLENGQFTELDLYVSYGLPIPSELVGLSVGYTEYTYPSGGGDADREVNLGAELSVPLSPSLSINYGVDGGIDKTLYLEASVGHKFELPGKVTLGLGAAVAYLDPDEGDDGFSHYTASAELGYGMVTVGITYIGQIDDDVLPDVIAATGEEEGSAGYDADIVGKIAVSHEF